MNTENNSYDNDFFEQVEQLQKRLIYIGFVSFVFLIFLLSTTVYFFLAIGGIVPPIDVVPFVPHV